MEKVDDRDSGSERRATSSFPGRDLDDTYEGGVVTTQKL